MAARREHVQAHRPACHLRAIRTGLGWSLAVRHGHSRHPELRAALYLLLHPPSDHGATSTTRVVEDEVSLERERYHVLSLQRVR